MNYFEGDNGGSTYKGVTRDEIRLGLTGQVVVSRYVPTVRLMVDHFNRRYEFYGRKINLLAFDAVGDLRQPGPQQSAAVKMDEELKVFAALSLSAAGGGENRFYVEELTRRKVPSFESGLTLDTSADIERYSPYFWAFAPPLDLDMRNTAEFYCKSLHGRVAASAGADQKGLSRKLAIVQVERAAGSADASSIQEGLKRCGAGPVREERFVVAGETDLRNRSTAADMRNSGITTVLCICVSAGELEYITDSMNEVGYQPEVLLGGLGALENPGAQQTDNYRSRMFGLSSNNKTIAPHDEPWYQAVRESNPNFSVPNNENAIYRAYFNRLRLLASGIQAAGPRLTPHTMEEGLFRIQFPNPNSAMAPYWQAGGGFRPGDHTFTDDFALIYWSDNAESFSGLSPRGDFCYIDRGSRWSLGTWPQNEHAFFDLTQPCR